MVREWESGRSVHVTETDPAELLEQTEREIQRLGPREKLSRPERQCLDDLKRMAGMLRLEMAQTVGDGAMVGNFTLEASGNGGDRFGSDKISLKKC